MEVKAQAKYVRIPTKKAKIVTDLVRGKPVKEALAILSFTPNYGARVTEEVLKSAIANAKNNYKLDPESLYISRIFADRATPFKRFRAQARGRGTQILHRQSHVTVYVSSREPAKTESKTKVKMQEKEEVKTGSKQAKRTKKEEATSGSKGTSKRA